MSSSADPINNPPTTGAGNVARLVDRLSMHIPNAQVAVPKKPPKPNNNNRTAHVRFSYVAQQEDELTLEEDDLIEVLEDVEDGWARGRLKEKVGLFPTNFVSFTNTPTTTSTSYSSSRLKDDEVRKRSRDEPQQAANGNGKVQAERTASSGSNVLPSSFKASVRKSTTSVPTTAAPSTSTTNSPAKSNASKEIAKVLYEYKATQPDELELREGDVITVLTRKCADEGWCEGELNGRRGLFPENFVKFTTATPPAGAPSSGPTPSRMTTSVASTAAVPPPVLPAKPLKSVGLPKKETLAEAPAAASPPTTTAPAAPASITTTTTTTSTTVSVEKPAANPTATPPAAPPASPPATNQHKTLEERKSMIAGLQSKLFPQGKMPPYKPTYQPPANVLTHANVPADGEAAPNEKPAVQMRHSVVDPTRLPPAQSKGDSEPPTSDDSDEPRQLESLTKFRPKQPGKRPPSSHIRLSRVPNGRDESPSTPPLTPPATAAPTLPAPSAPPADAPSVAVSTGPATTSFPAADRPPAPQSSPSTTTTAAAREIARELNAIGVAVANKSASSSPSGTNMGQRASRNHSAGSQHSNSHFHVGPKLSDAEPPAAASNGRESTITRAEFDEFRAEVFKRLARLEERLFKSDPTEPSELHHL